MLPSPENNEIFIGEHARWHFEGPTEQIYDHQAPTFDITPLEFDQNTGRVSSHRWSVEGCEFLSIEEDATLRHRSKAQAEEMAAYVFLVRCQYGTLRGNVLDRAIDYDPKGIYLIDEGLPGGAVSSRSAFDGIFIPKALLGFDPARHAPMIYVSKSPIMRDVLNADFDHLFDGLVRNNMLDRFRFHRMIATLKVTIDSELQDGDVRRRARENIENLICSFIEQRLDDPDLSVETILRSFGVSRASLYRMFEPRGGVRNYISERRVIRAEIDLSEQPQGRGKISAVSEKWGFPSLQRFNRSVRRQFGVAPSRLIGASG